MYGMLVAVEPMVDFTFLPSTTPRTEDWGYGFGFDVITKHAARSYTRNASVPVPKFDEGQRPIFGLHSRRRTAPAMPHEVANASLGLRLTSQSRRISRAAGNLERPVIGRSCT